MSQYGRRCPHCGGTHIAKGRRGANIGAAMKGMALFGIHGVWFGHIGKNDLMAECLECGFVWKIYHEPPKGEESGGILVVVISLIAVLTPLLLICKLFGFL